MKFIKKYEDISDDDDSDDSWTQKELLKLKYKEGDYVLIKDMFLKHLSDFFDLGYAQILKFESYRSTNQYKCRTTKNIKLMLDFDMFERKLTESEIKIYKQQLEANKYNL
jgi:hypothetical protein